MSRKNLLIIGGIVAVLVLAPVGWWLASPLWRVDVVDEAFPFDLPTVSEAEAMPAEMLESKLIEVMEKAEEMSGEMTDEEMDELAEQVQEVAAVMPDKDMQEDMPEAPAEWVQVSSGMFTGADDFHQGSGSAAIFQQGDTRILRLEDFMVTNGPDLHVLLVENIEGDMGEYVDLGSLKGNIGSQNYEIPADVDLSQFSGIMIYCMPFHVSFSTAPLN
ncbi:MAG: DM13 domain-containing protein [Anaerolineae bacterium]